MKRPLILVGLAVMSVAMVRGAAGKTKREALLRSSRQLLLTAAEAGGGRVTLTGIVQECGAVSKGTRISINQISIFQNDNSGQSLTKQHKIIFTTEETGTINQITEEGSSGPEYKQSGEVGSFAGQTAEKGFAEWEPDGQSAVPWEHEGLEPGDAVFVSGSVQTFDHAGNPGQFDMAEYYQGQNVVCALGKPELLGVKRGRSTVKSFLYRIRSLTRSSSLRVLSEEDARTVSAVGLGEKAWMDGEVKELYQESGIAHIASVSGLHVSLVGMGLYELLRRQLVRIGASGVLSGGVTVLYTILTGGSVSAVRACIMFLIWLLAQTAGRKYDMISAAFAAMAVILAGKPSLLTNSSFLLSFGAVFTIAVLIPVLREETLLPRTLVFSLGLCLGMLPITLYFFYQIPVWSGLVNLLVVPLMPAVMGFGLLGSLAGLVSRGLGIFLAAPAHYILRLFDSLCDLELRLPANLWVAGRPSAAAIFLYYGAICLTALLCRRKGRRFVKRCLWAVCLCLCMLLMGSRSPRDMEILCLDVGQGDSALLRMPTGEVFLVDGGSSTEDKVWTYRISQTLKYYGEGEIDGIFLSHGDADHINGIEEYLESYEPGLDGKNIHGITCRRLILPPTREAGDFSRLRELAREKGIEVTEMEEGGMLGRARSGRAGGGTGGFPESGEEAALADVWSFTCLSPKGTALTGDKNQDSMVLLFQYGTFRMLFTGDLEGETELSLVRSGIGLGADVLKVGHHGSKNASSEEFLSAVSPAVSVISCGKNNRYGHPAAETTDRLRAAGCGICQTDRMGAVLIRTAGTGSMAVTFFFSKNIKN